MSCFAAAINASAEVDGYYTYTVAGGGATITGFSGGSGAVDIPATLGGYPVVAIGDRAFLSKSSITSVTMPDTVTSIGYAAFAYCDSLSSITLSNNLISIGENAFFPAASLSSVTLPEGLVSIGQYAFASTSLSSIYLPSTLSNLGYCAINGIEVNVSPGNSYYTSIDGVLYDKALSTLIQCPKTKTGPLTIPASVINISDYAFSGSSLTSASIPDHVTSIGIYAFWGSHSLTSVTIPENLTTISMGAFSYCYALTSVTIPDNVTRIEYGAFVFCINLASVTIGRGVTTIDGSAFAQCSSLASIRFLGLVAPTSVYSDWIDGAPASLRGQADPSSNFPSPGEVWNGLKMGASIEDLPSAPNDLTAVFSNGQVRLNWNAPTSDGGFEIAYYQVYRSQNSTDDFIPIASPAVSYHNDSYLEGNWTYWYEVRAITAAGEGVHAIASVNVPVDPNQSSLPSPPRDLTYTASNDLIVLSWRPPASEGVSSVTQYLIYRNGLLFDVTTDLWYNDTDVGPDPSYTYDVIAENSFGVGTKTTISTTTSPVISLPSAPLDLSAVAGDGLITLYWHAPASNGNSAISDYKIYVNDVFHGSTGDGSLLAYTVTGLMNGRNYTFQVTAVNEMGEGPLSESVEAAPNGSETEGFAWHSSDKGYSLLVPPNWSVQDDTDVGDSHADTLLTGPMVDGFRTNVIVLTGTDRLINSSPNYLSDQITALRDGYQNTLGVSVSLSGTPQYVTISNHTAVIFGLDVPSYNVHQRMVVIVDEASNRYWIIVCSESATARSEIDPQFDVIIDNFVITAQDGPVMDAWLIIGIVLAIVLVTAVLAFSVLRAKKLKGLGRETAPLGYGQPTPASYCTHCGSKLMGATDRCPECKMPIAGNGPTNGNPGNEGKME